MLINKKEVGQRIRTIRLEKNYTLKEFGELLDTKIAAVSNWEKGRNLPAKDRMKKIALLGNVSVNYLLKGTLKDYVLSLIRNDLSSDNSKLYSTVENFLTFYDEKFIDFQNAAIFYDDNGKVISPEKYPSLIHKGTISDFIKIFSSELYSEFEKYAGNQLHYENDSKLLDLMLNFLTREAVYYSDTFIGKCNIAKKTINENMPFTAGCSDISIKEIEKGISKLPNTHTAIDLKYSSKLHDLEMDFLKKLNNLENEYNDLKNNLRDKE